MTQARAGGLLMAALFLLDCTYCGSSDLPQLNRRPLPAQRALAACTDCPADSTCNSLNVCVPHAWYCAPMYYAAGAQDGCDCDCGAPDPDCELSGAQTYCYGAGWPQQVSSCGACIDSP